ncbi:phosphoribosylformylglycinamidine cyclo-ligase [Peptoniphilus sp. AGMB00490]|uniref:Phosphoribosylformylglycinamidine cyclo-ligase n=1 Tax=Peptoniphilus faecalis TaxID=2731255 RepID=A0A848RG35_9FIRM|nr:phosphoribosylformylglycinamidine cyclo-ligase [Peptoniphilus faecalis]NMW84363.1 phosphoribosylformylglycinamidine cyclo-ligase [Peptoniphilus faecalis]
MAINYKDAGVDVDAGQREVELIKNIVAKTQSKDVLSSIGGFSGLFNLDLSEIKHPVLVSGTDGVGTKVILAHMLNKHDTIGIDCVAMCVNDILCQGAKPLFFLDYIATGKLIPEKMEEIVKGVAEGCIKAQASLIGGETAEMPGVYQEDQYDLAGFCVGVVDRDKIIDGSSIKEGDIVFGLSSNGVHSNGYSLVRKIIFDHCNFDLNEKFDELECTLGEELLKPTRIYVKEVLELLKTVNIKGMSHITGGGFYENIPRMIPDGLCAKVDASVIETPEIFKLLKKWADINDKDMYSTFNMGVGLTIVVSEDDRERVVDFFKNSDLKLYELGKIISGEDKIELSF